jgi:hypothetical protein
LIYSAGSDSVALTYGYWNRTLEPFAQEYIPSSQRTIHPEYNSTTLENNLAILRRTAGIDFAGKQ